MDPRVEDYCYGDTFQLQDWSRRGQLVHDKGLKPNIAGAHGRFVLTNYLPYMKPELTCVFPNAHCMLHGLVRNFVELVFGVDSLKDLECKPTQAHISKMQVRFRCVKLTRDYRRPIRDPTKAGASTCDFVCPGAGPVILPPLHSSCRGLAPRARRIRSGARLRSAGPLRMS